MPSVSNIWFSYVIGEDPTKPTPSNALTKSEQAKVDKAFDIIKELLADIGFSAHNYVEVRDGTELMLSLKETQPEDSESMMDTYHDVDESGDDYYSFNQEDMMELYYKLSEYYYVFSMQIQFDTIAFDSVHNEAIPPHVAFAFYDKG